MLTHDELMDLYRTYRDDNVLSVYLDAEQHDPAGRNAWRKVLDHAVAEVRASVTDAYPAQIDAFDDALGLLRAELDRFDASLPDKGWVGFATGDRVLYAESVPVPMPNLVRWEPSIRAAPYVRALKQERRVVTVLTDSRRARIFRYQDGQMVEPLDLRADMFLGDLTDVNMSKRGTRHTGVRGEAGTDVAHRLHDVETDRKLKRLTEVVTDQAGNHGFVVLGGTPEMVAAAAKGLPKAMNGRVLERPSLHLEMSAAEVKEATQEAASELTRQQQNAQLDQVLDAAHAHGRGCLGREETEKALRDRRVETLFLSRRFIGDDPDNADFCVGAALEQGADVEELSGNAAGRLDAEGGGIAAGLRYRL
ncbi:MAG: hypothetical protein ACREMQ_08810 [Longimicrobiales bacterium]